MQFYVQNRIIRMKLKKGRATTVLTVETINNQKKISKKSQSLEVELHKIFTSTKLLHNTAFKTIY